MNDSRLPHRRNTLLCALGILVLLTGCSSLSSNNSGGNNPPPASVTVNGATQVRLGSTTTFTVTVTNLSNPAITWQVNGVNGGNSTVGTITSAGVYTPPATLPATNPVTVIAVSVASPSAFGTAQVNIFNPSPVITAVSRVKVRMTCSFE